MYNYNLHNTSINKPKKLLIYAFLTKPKVINTYSYIGDLHLSKYIPMPFFKFNKYSYGFHRFYKNREALYKNEKYLGKSENIYFAFCECPNEINVTEEPGSGTGVVIINGKMFNKILVKRILSEKIEDIYKIK